MTKLIRMPLKYVRDKAKARYEKGTLCEICGEIEDLDYHHYNGLSELYHHWTLINRLDEDDVINHRDQFIEEHQKELYEEAVTLCHSCHLALHAVYGKNPGLGTAKKQARWIGIQRDKHELV